jgi:class 3 adenylate cyclase
MNCGSALASRCASCQADLMPGSRFCSSCGQPVAGATPIDDDRLSRLAAATPAPLAEKIRAAGHIDGERKVVTALFADVVGSTTLAEQMDAEEWTAIMNRAFDRLSPVIYRYEGTIARLLGDAVLAFFGAPVAHEDDPIRAVHAALEFINVAREYSAEVSRSHNIRFEIRVGLNTGPVVVGKVGSDLKYEYTAMGDAVNLAARMQSAAKPMTVLISQYTYNFAAPAFDFTDLGWIEVKGKAEPVHVYEVRGLKAVSGPARGLAGLESPMVGRDPELHFLMQLTAAVETGLGRVAVVIGEPGLGKTRLVAEWKNASTEAGTPGRSPLQWAEGHCLSYGRGHAYHLLLDLLRSIIGVASTAEEDETRAALQAKVEDLFGDSALEVFPYLARMLSLQLEGEALKRVQRLDPQVLQTQYLAAFRRLIGALAARQPLCLICEDIHWADSSSIELLIRLIPLASEAPVLFCFVTRPYREAPGWKLVTAAREVENPQLTELNLLELPEAESRKLVSNLLGLESLPEHIWSLLFKKAEGNPFFAEELIRMLIEEGAIVEEGKSWVLAKEIETVNIPDNLQGLLLARIDRLPEDAKHTLRVASVIGRQFSLKVLQEVLHGEE